MLFSLDALFSSSPHVRRKLVIMRLRECTNLRVLSIPQTIDIEILEDMITDECDTIYFITQIPHPSSSYQTSRVNRSIVDFSTRTSPHVSMCRYIEYFPYYALVGTSKTLEVWQRESDEHVVNEYIVVALLSPSSNAFSHRAKSNEPNHEQSSNGWLHP